MSCECDVHCGLWNWRGNTAPLCTSKVDVKRSEENNDTWWYRTPSFFMTMQGVTALLLSRTSCATGNGIFWNIHLTHPIWVHALTISSLKWENHYEGPGTTQDITYQSYKAVNMERQQRWTRWGVQLPNNWQKVINKEGDYTEGT